MMVMNRIKQFWNSVAERLSSKHKDRAFDPFGIARMLQACPACGKSLSLHEYAQIAITIATEANRERTTQFFKALEEHRWSDTMQFQEFDGRYNAAEAFALRCPSGAVTVLMVRDPVELWESSSVISHKVLNAEEGAQLSEVVESGKWRTLK